MTHTSGPWKVVPMGRLVLVEAARYFGICHVLRNTDGPIMSDHLCLANARVIAVAPALLSVCKKIFAEVGSGNDLDWHLRESGLAKELEDAINLVEGEE